MGVVWRGYKGGNGYECCFSGDSGRYGLCGDKVVCKRVYEVERIVVN